MVVKKAKLQDISNLVELNKQLADYHHQLDYYFKNRSEIKDYHVFLKRHLNDSGFLFLIAKDNKKVLGYLSAQIKISGNRVEEAKIAHISDIYIVPEFRGKGVAKTLFKEFIVWAKNEKADQITLNVHLQNKIGIKFWESLGFSSYFIKMRKKLK